MPGSRLHTAAEYEPPDNDIRLMWHAGNNAGLQKQSGFVPSAAQTGMEVRGVHYWHPPHIPCAAVQRRLPSSQLACLRASTAVRAGVQPSLTTTHTQPLACHHVAHATHATCTKVLEVLERRHVEAANLVRILRLLLILVHPLVPIHLQDGKGWGSVCWLCARMCTCVRARVVGRIRQGASRQAGKARSGLGPGCQHQETRLLLYPAESRTQDNEQMAGKLPVQQAGKHRPTRQAGKQACQVPPHLDVWRRLACRLEQPRPVLMRLLLGDD